ncbi:MAG TPA: spermidine/putrescine ABC transporter ATP-binding protein [Clostridiales bacterium]|nr:spermidine/putrescine ABC transporter ATP-binding protein [Clostridiales bacterium]
MTISHVSKSFGSNQVVQDLNLEVKKGEFLTLLGPSGCGKTTTLRMIAGFETPTSGRILLGGRDVKESEPYDREVNTVFQNYALFPHMNVYENIAFGLTMKKTPKEEIKRRVMEMLTLVQLEGYENRRPDQLSGGQKQRVAIARALINRPKVLLLDEPLGALDLKLRKQMQFELKRLQKKLGITFIYVTHDQEEALTMSDRVMVMKDGNILQTGTPQDIYNEPANAFVADFIGESNIVDGIMQRDFLVEFAGREFDCVDKGFDPQQRVDGVIRPEDLKVVSAMAGQFSGVVESVIFKGVHYEMTVDACGYKWLIHSTISEQPGSIIGMEVAPADIHIMYKTEEEE